MLFKLLLISICLKAIEGHGRLMSPAARGSAWRYGFKTPVNYNDEGLYCGGYATQWKNNGRCGVCGDSWSASVPRNHEYLGRFVRRPPQIVATYKAGSEIEVKVDLTANHGGFFVFQLCPANNETEVSEQCLESNTLVIAGQEPKVNPNLETPIDGLSDVDDSSNDIDSNWNSHDSTHENHYGRHPIDLKGNIQTVINPLNQDRYNYEIDRKVVESANVQIISNTGASGNRFNPVLDDLGIELKPYKYKIPFEKARVYQVKVKLPPNVTCQRCVFRWIYITGNSWGVCQRKGYRGRVGCGPQEEFRNCADISIN